MRGGNNQPKNKRTTTIGYTELTEIPPPPPWLDDEGKKKYNEVMDHIISAGVAQIVDTDIVTVYAENWSTFVRASGILQEEGMQSLTARGKSMTAHPMIKVRSEAMKYLKDINRMLFFNPYTRKKENMARSSAAKVDKLGALL